MPHHVSGINFLILSVNQSMVDIQPAAAEIRRGKKERQKKKKIERNHRAKI